ncbi:MAG TPA: inositol monophosphatase [Candidatus Saccharimonadales bacterium]|nr:inositol monophosphatase [Candidatus Saccharimonadales bacterium]
MYKDELEFAQKLAKKAGAIMLDYFSLDKQIKYKDDASPVTIADKKVNRLVIEELSKEFDYGIIGEEESTTEYGKEDTVWICDPIDGTRAFIYGIPTAMFSLGLVHKGKPVLGVAYDPFLGRMFYGLRGKGSYCNGRKLKVSDGGLDGHNIGIISEASELVKIKTTVEKIVRRGANAVYVEGAVYKSCLVAEGKFVGYFSDLPKTHDLAAISVILEEAGGKLTAPDGSLLDFSKYFEGAVVSNGIVHEELLEILNS